MLDEFVIFIIVSYVDGIFFFNICELLKILVVLFIGSIEVERLFFCFCRFYIWLRLIMIMDRFFDLFVIVMYGNMMVVLEIDRIC